MHAKKLTASVAPALIALPAIVATVVIIAALAAAVPAAAAEGGGSTAQVTGWIVDEWCQSGNANPNGKSCSLDCHKKGAALVLYDPDRQKVYHLDAQDEAAKNVGRVTVTGQLDGDSFKVARIEPAPEAR